MSPPPLPHVLVISLPQSHARRERMVAQLEKTGLPCRFIEAIDGTQLRDVQEYSSLKRRIFFGRDMTAGEIGCLLSHRKTYKTIIDENIPCALILEDDAILSPDLPDVLDALMRRRGEWDMVRFLGSEKALRQARVLSPLDDVYSLARPCGTPGGAYAYLIHTQAAEKLYRLTRQNYTPIDTLHGYLWRTCLRTLMLVPSPVKPDMEVPSTIGAARFSKKTDLPMPLRLAYPLTRAGMKFYEALFKHGTALALRAADAISAAGRTGRGMPLHARAMIRLRRSFYKRRGGHHLVRRAGTGLLLDAQSGLDLHMLSGRCHETAQLAKAKELIDTRDIDTMLDIGANFGLYACTLARDARLREVHCFEPVQRTYNQLCGNIFLNRLDKKVTAHRIAASDMAGTARIHISAKSSGIARLGHRENALDESESVTLRQLDHVLDFSRRRIFAKIDVEGHEYAVLSGMKRLLRDNAMFLQVEIWDAEKREKVSALLSACGYVLTGRMADDHYFEKRAAL